MFTAGLAAPNLNPGKPRPRWTCQSTVEVLHHRSHGTSLCNDAIDQMWSSSVFNTRLPLHSKTQKSHNAQGYAFGNSHDSMGSNEMAWLQHALITHRSTVYFSHHATPFLRLHPPLCVEHRYWTIEQDPTFGQGRKSPSVVGIDLDHTDGA